MTSKKNPFKVKKWLRSVLQKPENIYLIVATVAVTAFVFITPPFQGPDEEAHYIRVQYLAHGRFFPSQDIEIPHSIEDVTRTTFYADDIRGKTNVTYDIGLTSKALDIPLDSKGTYRPPMVTYNPLLYIPAVPGTAIANTFNLSAIVSLYIARLSIALTAVFIIFASIKILPSKKFLAVAVGLVPMMLFQQSVISADSISYALLFLFISYILFLRERQVISLKQWVLVGLLSIGIAVSKPLVFIFLPILFMLVKSKKALIWSFGIIAVCIGAYFSFGLLNSQTTSIDESAAIHGLPNEVNDAEQLSNLIEHPSRGLRVAWNSYMTSYGDDEVRGVIGVFGAADTLYPLWMFSAYVVIIGILFVLSVDGQKVKAVRLRWKLIVLLLSVSYFAAVNLALYLGYTPVNFDIVYGVQGRYFLPIVIATTLILSVGGIVLSRKDSRKIIIWTMSGVVFLVFLALFITFQRYYLYTP